MPALHPRILVAALLAIAGLVLLSRGQAANFAVSYQAEQGSLAGNAAPGETAGASGGGSVRFGSSAGAGSGPGYYVDCTSGSDNNSGTSPAAAWRTTSKINGLTFRPGDTVYLARGCNFAGAITVKGNGTAQAPITLDAYGSGNAPLITANAVYGISLTGSNQTVQNLKIVACSNSGVVILAQYGTVNNTEVTNCGTAVTIREGSHFSKVYKVYAHDLKMIKNTPGGDDDYGANGFLVSANNCEISYSRCVNCKAPSHDYTMDGGFVEVWHQADNLYVHHNWAEETQGFVESGTPGGGTAANMRFAHNVLFNTYAIIVNHSLPTPNLRFEHNTVYNTKSFNNIGAFYQNQSGTVLRNNIIYTWNSAGVTPGTHTNNLYFRTGGAGSFGYALGQGEKFGNPLFVNAAAGDFRLQAGSPARGMGAGGLGYPVDYNQQAMNAPPDAGAFQFKQ